MPRPEIISTNERLQPSSLLGTGTVIVPGIHGDSWVFRLRVSEPSFETSLQKVNSTSLYSRWINVSGERISTNFSQKARIPYINQNQLHTDLHAKKSQRNCVIVTRLINLIWPLPFNTHLILQHVNPLLSNDCKQRPFLGNGSTQQCSNWEAVFSTRSLRQLRDATVDYGRGVFYLSLPRCYKQENSSF
jgi:hypothetical protein